MKTYYWQMRRKNGSLVEGRFSLARRVFGRMLLGEKYWKIGPFYQEFDGWERSEFMQSKQETTNK